MISTTFKWAGSSLEKEYLEKEYLSKDILCTEFMRSKTWAYTMQYGEDKDGKTVLFCTVYFVKEDDKVRFIMEYL